MEISMRLKIFKKHAKKAEKQEDKKVIQDIDNNMQKFTDLN